MISGFYGFIPLSVRQNKNLKPNSKLLYAEITACLEKDGICVKTNAYLSKVLGIGKSALSNCLTELRREGFISVEMILEKGTQKFLKRYIRLTPTFLMGGVNDNPQDTPSFNMGGVSNDSPLTNGDTPTNYEQTLLYNNNIHKNYIDAHIKVTPIHTDISDSQAFALTSIVNMFLNKQQRRFPHLYKGKSKNDLVNKSINTLFEIITKDGIEYDVIKNVLKWALEHNFWHSHVTLLHTLRNKASNGNRRFHNILTDYKSKGGSV